MPIWVMAFPAMSGQVPFLVGLGTMLLAQLVLGPMLYGTNDLMSGE